jgi:hypothetical protein
MSNRNGTASLYSYCILQIDLSNSTVLSVYAYSQERNEAVHGVQWCERAADVRAYD